jgi:hypothetical protein
MIPVIQKKVTALAKKSKSSKLPMSFLVSSVRVKTALMMRNDTKRST